ncbi:unnamed protein product [Calypogeia fissa]
METTPAKRSVTYKRRRSGGPLSELPWNASDVAVDPESAVSLLASDDEGVENFTPAKKRRKKWSVQSLPRRQTRSSTASGGHSTPLKDRAVRAIGTLFGKKEKGKEKEKGKVVEIPPTKGKENVKEMDIERTPRKNTETDKGRGVDRTPTPRKHTARKQASKDSPVGGGPGSWHSPIEFVIEKRAMFAEIDAFELESEEEEAETIKTTGKEMLSDSSGEIMSLASSRGETSEPPKQVTQNVTSTDEVREGETSVEPPNITPEQSTQDVTSNQELNQGETTVQPPNTRPEETTQG